MQKRNYQQLQPEERMTIPSMRQQGSSEPRAGAQHVSDVRLCVGAPMMRMWPNDPALRVSHETIYTAIYAQQRGDLRRQLIACLRHGHSTRMSRRRGTDRRGQIRDMMSIHVGPPEVEDRVLPGHWEGDFIKGAGNQSSVGVAGVQASPPGKPDTCLQTVLHHKRSLQNASGPYMQEVDPQHPLQPNRRQASLALRVIRLDDRQQPRPRDDLLHLAEKALTPGHPLLARTFRFRKTDLPLHRRGSVP
jgi:hypothetical protein